MRTLPSLALLPLCFASFACGPLDDGEFDSDAMDSEDSEGFDSEGSDSTGEPPLPSHAGESCDVLGAAQECSDGVSPGIEVCVGYWDTGTWSDCYVEHCNDVGSIRSCMIDDSHDGIERCVEAGAFEPIWGICAPERCEPGVYNCGLGGEFEDWTWECTVDAVGASDDSQRESCSTPLVLSFDDAGGTDRLPKFLAPASTSSFDVTGSGTCEHPHWPTAATPWLARDLDRSGTIDGGHELFGSGTVLASGARARNGFEALAALDDNRDGALTPADAAWPELLVWSDLDADRQTDGWELLPLSAHGVDALPLAFTPGGDCDARGNCSGERAAFTFQRGGLVSTGQLVDVYLTCE